MKIITRAEFLKCPMGTLFSYYEPECFHDLMIKADEPGNYENDFLYDDIIGAIDNNSSNDRMQKCEAMERGESVPMDFEYTSREGLFEDEQLFAVYEKADVEKLITRLTNALTPTNR